MGIQLTSVGANIRMLDEQALYYGPLALFRALAELKVCK